MERAFLSDFDVLKGTADLLGRNLIERGRAPVEVVEAPAGRPPVVERRRVPGFVDGLWGRSARLARLSVYLIPRNPGQRPPAAAGRDRAVTARPREGGLAQPRRLRSSAPCGSTTTRAGATRGASRTWSWRGSSRKTRCEIRTAASTATSCEPKTAKFGLYGRNAAGQIDLDLSLERSLAPVSELRPAPSRTSPRKPARACWSSSRKNMSLMDLDIATK